MKRIFNMLLTVAVLLSFLLFCFPAFGAEAEALPRYGIQTITEPNVKYVYDLLAAELTKDSPAATVELEQSKAVSAEELRKAYSLFLSDYPECFWLRAYSYSHIGGAVIGITPEYSFSGDALREAKAAVEEAADEILAGLPTGDNYEKALYLHDQLAARVTYEMVGEHQTVYGALAAGKAVCAGYAAAYQLLLQKAGICAWTVTGDSVQPGGEAIPHAWNLVWIEDDVCVYTDVTWDDSEAGLFHYYLNVSKREIDLDHTVDADLFSLPDCNHEDQSYFDRNNHRVTDSTTVEELASLFGPAEGGERKAVLHYEGTDLDGFIESISQNRSDLFRALSCGSGSCSYRISAIANELHITVTANFPPMTYLVDVQTATGMIAYENPAQYVVIGEEMKPLTVMAKNGYYFPAEYAATGSNGILVERVNAKQITVSGTPTAATTISLPNATAMQKESTPQAVYTPTDENGCGTLSAVTAGMKYSLDGTQWIDITSDREIVLTELFTQTIYLIRTGNGESTMDSDRQTVVVSNPLTPPEETNEETTPNRTDGSDNDIGTFPSQSTKEPSKTDSTVSGAMEFGCSSTAGSTALLLAVLLAAWSTVKKKKQK